MKQRTDRFAYEAAEGVLDAFAVGRDRNQGFLRAYHKFKYTLTAYAYVDFAEEGVTEDIALSLAWEDAQVAFAGYGEPMMTGAVCQLWYHAYGAEKKRFYTVLVKAFSQAEAATHDSVARRYLKRWRDRPPHDPDGGFHNAPVMPVTGVKLRDWLAEEGVHDPLGYEEKTRWLEMAERLAPKPKPLTLSLIRGGKS